jgi:hypothetical protein
MAPVSLFMSYSHKDEHLRAQLEEHLASLRRDGLVDVWHDRKLVPGEEWDAKLMEQLEAAGVIVLLVSSAFIASEFCWSRELAVAMARHEDGTACVVPVVVRPSEWSASPFAKLQALPRGAKAVTLWSNRDEAWLDVAKGLRQAIAGLPAPVAAPRKRAGARPRRAPETPTATAPDPPRFAQSGQPRRRVFDGIGGTSLPGTLVREEDGAPAADATAERVFEWLGHAHRFLYDAFGRDSIDGNGAELLAVVHYGTNYANGFWDGRHAVLGDGDDEAMRSLASTPDVTYKQVMNGFVQHAASFDYQGQAGSLHDAAAIVFALMARQFVLRQPVEAADWRFGAGLLLPRSGLTVIADPSTPATWKDFAKAKTDSGGVHANSPIVQHAFFGLAVALGGQAWERAGRVWYDALVDPQLAPDSTFRQFAARTVGAARARFGDAGDEVGATRDAWVAVGIKP